MSAFFFVVVCIKQMMFASAAFLAFMTVCTFKTAFVVPCVTVERGVFADYMTVPFYRFLVYFHVVLQNKIPLVLALYIQYMQIKGDILPLF